MYFLELVGKVQKLGSLALGITMASQFSSGLALLYSPADLRQKWVKHRVSTIQRQSLKVEKLKQAGAELCQAQQKAGDN